MKRTPALLAALFASLLGVFSSLAQAQSCTNGNAIFHRKAAGVDISCSQASCHGADPAANKNNILNGQQANVIDMALDTVADMAGLRSSLNLTTSDLNDLALYIWYRAGNQSCPAGSPSVSANPTSAAFGNQTVGTSSASQTITISNTGGAAATSMVYPAAPANFTKGGTCANGSLAAGASCTVVFTFSPTAAGTFTPTYTITGAGGISVPISLSGTGVAAAANLQASPTTAAFGSVAVGQTSATQSITVTNSGSASASGIAFSNPDSAEFLVTGNTCGATLAAGASCTFSLAYKPSAPGADNVTLTINYTGGSTTVAMSGTGTAAPAALGASPTSLAFGNVTVGQTSAGTTVTVTNSGGSAATSVAFANSNAAEFVVSGNTCGTTINAGASCTLAVAYAPTAVGADNASLTISYAGGTSVVVNLSGTGTAPAPASLQANPTTLAFGSVTVGQASAGTTVTVTNSGGSAATGVAFTNSNATEFVVSGNTCGTTINAGASCTLSVAYTPSAAGADNATLTITYGGGAPVVINMSGTGVAPAVANLQAAPTSLAFGSVTVGQTSAGSAVTVTNTGGATANGVAFANSNATEFVVSGNTCGTTINAGASCTLSVAYTPSATGADNATLTISYTGGTPVVVNLSGTGTAPAAANLQASPASLAFGNVTVGQSGAGAPIVVTNSGGATATGVAFANSNAAEFVVSGNNCGTTINAGASCTLSVAYTPSAAGADNATLTISYAGGTPVVVSMSGTGTAPTAANLQAAPTSLAFGNVTVGQTSAASTVTVTNTGGAAANGVAFANSNAAKFVVSGNNCGTTINAGASCTLSVAYAPNAAGADNATLTISYTGGASVVVNLSGTGTVPTPAGLQVNPASLAFGNVTVGTTATAKVVTVTNTGGSAATGVSLANTNAAEFAVSGNTCGTTINAGASCTLSVTYAPSAVGSDNDTLTVNFAGAAGVAIALSGSGTTAPAANVQASPAPIAFGNVTVGQTSAGTLVTISNSGAAAATGVTFANSNAAEFVVSGNNCGTTINAGASCTFTVAYAPNAPGADSATLTISYAGGGAVSIAMSGTGVASAPPPGAGQLSLPSAVTFGDQGVGSASAAQTVTVGNVGSAAVTVSSIVSSNAGEFAVKASTCGVVNAGATCSFTLTFTPGATGSRTATVTVTSNGAGSPQTISVTGNGVTGGTPPPTQATVTAIEYYHQAFDHYFITTLETEITKLDNGTFVGWQRTGRSFKVFPNPAAGLNAVCRFFSTAFGPKSSHFYTPNEQECSVVKTNPNWTFEAEVFYVQYPDFDGNCPASTMPVYRVYNDGQGGAPNHRYTTDMAVRNAMLALGWIAEGAGKIGVIMCAPM